MSKKYNNVYLAKIKLFSYVLKTVGNHYNKITLYYTEFHKLYSLAFFKVPQLRLKSSVYSKYI